MSTKSSWDSSFSVCKLSEKVSTIKFNHCLYKIPHVCLGNKGKEGKTTTPPIVKMVGQLKGPDNPTCQLRPKRETKEVWVFIGECVRVCVCACVWHFPWENFHCTTSTTKLMTAYEAMNLVCMNRSTIARHSSMVVICGLAASLFYCLFAHTHTHPQRGTG